MKISTEGHFDAAKIMARVFRSENGVFGSNRRLTRLGFSTKPRFYISRIKISAHAHFDATKIMEGVSHSENLMFNSRKLWKRE